MISKNPKISGFNEILEIYFLKIEKNQDETLCLFFCNISGILKNEVLAISLSEAAYS